MVYTENHIGVHRNVWPSKIDPRTETWQVGVLGPGCNKLQLRFAWMKTIVWIPFFLQYFNHRRCSKQFYKPIPGALTLHMRLRYWIDFMFCKFAIEPWSVDVVTSRWIWAPKLNKFIYMENYSYGGLSGSIPIFWYLNNRRKNQRSSASICTKLFWAWSLLTDFISSSSSSNCYLGSHLPRWQKIHPIRPHGLATVWDRKGNCQQRLLALKLVLLSFREDH